MATLGCIGLCFKDTFSKPEPYLSIGLIIGVAAAVALAVLGSLQIVPSTYDPSQLVVSDVGKTIGYFMGAGAALGLSALALQYLLERKIESLLDKSLSNQTRAALRWVRLVFSICVLAAAVLLICWTNHYLSGMTSAYDNWGHLIGGMGAPQTVINAYGGLVGSMALSVFGFSALMHAIITLIPDGGKRIIVKEIVSTPVNAYLEEDSGL